MDMHIVMIGHVTTSILFYIYVYINILNVSRNSYLVLVTNVTVRCMKSNRSCHRNPPTWQGIWEMTDFENFSARQKRTFWFWVGKKRRKVKRETNEKQSSIDSLLNEKEWKKERVTIRLICNSKRGKDYLFTVILKKKESTWFRIEEEHPRTRQDEHRPGPINLLLLSKNPMEIRFMMSFIYLKEMTLRRKIYTTATMIVLVRTKEAAPSVNETRTIPNMVKIREPKRFHFLHRKQKL